MPYASPLVSSPIPSRRRRTLDKSLFFTATDHAHNRQLVCSTYHNTFVKIYLNIYIYFKTSKYIYIYIYISKLAFGGESRIAVTWPRAAADSLYSSVFCLVALALAPFTGSSLDNPRFPSHSPDVQQVALPPNHPHPTKRTNRSHPAPLWRLMHPPPTLHG